jgi:hypothetical protein
VGKSDSGIGVVSGNSSSASALRAMGMTGAEGSARPGAGRFGSRSKASGSGGTGEVGTDKDAGVAAGMAAKNDVEASDAGACSAVN